MIALRTTAPFSITTSGMMTLSVTSAPLPMEQPVELDERLLATPSLALGRCRAVAGEMAD